MRRSSRTASLFDAVQAPVPAPRLPPPAAPEPLPQVAARQLWAAVYRVSPTDAATLHQLGLQALQFSSRVCLEAPDALVLEVRASLRLFGGLGPLWQQLRGQFQPAAVVSMAPTPLAALALARTGQRVALTDARRLVSRLAVLPLASLGWAPASLQRLSATGVTTIGEALRLPRAGFAQRFGRELLGDLDRLLGRCADPRVAFRPEERFAVRFEPSFETTRTDALLRELQPHLLELQRFLLQRQRGITALLLLLEHRRQPSTRVLLRLAAPEHLAQRLSALLAERLSRVALPGPVRRVALRSGPLWQAALGNANLWQPGEQGGGATAQMPGFLHTLRARLGDQAVQGLALRPDHRPERLSQVAEPQLQFAGAADLAAPPWSSDRRPLWLLPAPQPLQQDASGWPVCDGQRLRLLAGPERLETGWWDGQDIRRDYYMAADAAEVRLWVFRERDGQRRWFLHGPFG